MTPGEYTRSDDEKIRISSSKKYRLIILFILGVFLFVCSLEGVKSGFKLIFAEWQKNILGMVEANTAPITGLALGILGTALVQSSSAVIATTMVSMSGMVVSGLPLESAIRFGVPMVLGANIGTTITNTIVVFGVKRGMTMEEFGEAVPCVIVDDVYEALTIGIFFIIEMSTGFLSKIVIMLGKFYAEALKLENMFTIFDKTLVDIVIKDPIIKPVARIMTMFLGNKIGGIALFAIWFIIIVFSMGLITKALDNLIELEWEDKVKAAFSNPFKGFFTGFSITWIVGSSSIGASLVIPFLATKVVDLRKAYPYLCGCNMATTVDLSQIYGYLAGGVVGMMLGSAHVMLNIIALLLWLVSPLRFVPVKISEFLGRKIVANKNATFSLILWVAIVFFVVPLIIIYIS